MSSLLLIRRTSLLFCQWKAVYVEPGIEAVFEDDKVRAQESASEMLTECQNEALEAVGSSSSSAESAIAGLVECVEYSIAEKIKKASDEVSFQTTVRKRMGDLLENYTCADYELNTTEAESTDTWYSEGVTRNVDILINRPASKVHVVKNFIDEEECLAMEEAAKPTLHRATVADGTGGSELSKNRKALQAGVKVPWDLERAGDPIARVSRRVYNYVNYVLDLDIDEHGQEDLMSIQYTGRGEDEEEPDRYMPHCDGDCTGLEFKHGNRMATIVMYCTIPEKGGATNFNKAGLHVVPEKGSATFFSYIDPETHVMDKGFTEHSGCPVIEGEKKIVTQWVRLGVTKQTPWTAYNTRKPLSACLHAICTDNLACSCLLHFLSSYSPLRICVCATSIFV
mmetsp:Transcript_49487/g.74672  ORF Transcript_49487/g.74672 Transcript_49487/m.74672 type:complete len:396 (-) Transcript_49487:3420-4607(-)